MLSSHAHKVYFLLKLDFFEQVVSTALESFPSIWQMKNEQKMIVRKVIEGRDVFTELPTGFGKSLTYQILPGVCKALREAGKVSFPEFPLVFIACPLKSIMVEQVQSLRNKKIATAHIGESADIDRKIEGGTTEFSLIFGSPESMIGDSFQSMFELPIYR